ncbi:hypothetical protein RDV89_09465 [Nocardioides zeae]|uniref:DUF5666 domain-containing protein n=1 Tax=Nocardioides imazamoxiresistens TaxID=3231893 RepID=A0ABU3PVT4_9ACTN|nr:hypothetical protein [Nocardioides zeae]MDT9593294.1 hypothetical protein [Nocardioides zeae]
MPPTTLSTGIVRTGALAASGVMALSFAAYASADTPDAGDGTTERPGGRGAAGLVTSVGDDSAEVEGADGTVTVTWTDDTTFTERVEGSLDDVAVGSCVAVGPAGDVTVREAVDGECGPVGPGGRPASDEDAPEPPADGEAPARPVRGIVTAVSDTGFTVESTAPRRGGDDTDADAEAESVTVTVDDDTTFWLVVEADSSAVQEGRCLTARGAAESTDETTDETADDSTVTAAAVTVGDAVDGECASGPAGPGDAGGPGAHGPGADGTDGPGAHGDRGPGRGPGADAEDDDPAGESDTATPSAA